MRRPAGPDERSLLLERAAPTAALNEALVITRRTRSGVAVLVSGEAGIGKTALVGDFVDRVGAAGTTWWGACDGLLAPQPLAAMHAIARGDGALERALAVGARAHEIADSLIRDLRREGPSIVVFEDLHWADEATLDVLRLLLRRLERVPALIVATFRDDELSRTHPLRMLLGDVARRPDRPVRLALEPLSEVAVAILAEAHAVAADELFAKTRGNPFFVTEVLATGRDEIPDTVREAVLARAARLSPGARRVLDVAAILQPRAEAWLLRDLVTEPVDDIDECLASGMLTTEGQAVVFRHELARLAIEESLTPVRRTILHRAALERLATPPSGGREPARLAHHAELAADATAVLEYAPRAAAAAAAVGAHREAASQYARALRFAGSLGASARADLLEHAAHESYLADRIADAIGSLEEAIAIRRTSRDRLREGDDLRSFAQMLWSSGSSEQARRAARQAVRLLEVIAPGRELALSLAVLASREMNADAFDAARETARRAIELADSVAAPEIAIHATNTLGTIQALTAGRFDRLEESLRRAEALGLHEEVARAHANLAYVAVRTRNHVRVDAALPGWIAYCADHGLDLWRGYLVAYRARLALDRGRWDDASQAALEVARGPLSSPLPRITALIVLGLVRARRGDPQVWVPLDEARSLVLDASELQRTGPVAAARAEAAWLEGRTPAAVEETEWAWDLARQRGDPWITGELAALRRMAGMDDVIPPVVAQPYRLRLEGRWSDAAGAWDERGAPYEAAIARILAEDEALVRRGLRELQELGAVPAARMAMRRLRARGARRLPRGPRRDTRAHPANLTPREVEVLSLVAQGLHNAEIADRLVLATKTVDHHVSAILRKLDVRTRTDATRVAERLRLATEV